MSLASLRGLASSYREDPLLRYREGGMTPPQEKLHRCLSRKRLMRAPNRVGKTISGAAEAWWHLSGSHPYREVAPAPNQGVVLASDLKTGWKAISAALRYLEPPGWLHESCNFVEGVGYLYRGQKMVRTTQGSLLVGTGCEQSPMALESSKFQWGWVDEPPKPQHWSGLRTRLAIDLGPLWVTLTPINRPVGWLRQVIEGDEETGFTPTDPGWDVTVASLTPEDCPFRSRENLQVQISETPSWEKAQRIYAEWEGYSVDRWITGFTDSSIFDEVPKDILEVGLSWDHGERPGSSVCYLLAWDGEILWTLAEWANESPTTPEEEVKEIVEMIAQWGLKPEDISFAVGDSNSAGFLGVGRSVNEVLEDSFQAHLGSYRAPFEIQTPHKGKGSIKARARLLSTALSQGRARVHESCTRLKHALRHWAGKDDDLKHAVDAWGYGAENYLGQRLKSAKIGPGPHRRERP